MFQDPQPAASKDLIAVLRLLRWALYLVFAVLAWVVLSYLAHVLAPILAAIGIAYLLDPVLDRLVRRGTSRSVGAGILLAIFLVVAAVVLVAGVPHVTAQISEFLANLPRFVQNLAGWVQSRFSIQLPSTWTEYLQSEQFRHALGGVSEPLRAFALAAVGGLFSILGVLAEMLLVPVFAFYFLADWPHLWRRLEHMVPPRRRATVRELVRQVDAVVSNWVRGQAIVTSILAVLYATAFTIIGIPLSVPIGLLVGTLTVIPFIGTFVGAIIAVLVTLGGGGSLAMVGAVAGVIVVLHVLEAGVLTPKIVGHRVGLSESAALLAVVAGGKLLGFVGVVLAVPIAATVAVLIRYLVAYYERTAFFGHESDADVEITPAMALVIPGHPWLYTDDGAYDIEDRAAATGLHADAPAHAPGTAYSDGWDLEPELGPSGVPQATKPDMVDPAIASDPSAASDPAAATDPDRPPTR